MRRECRDRFLQHRLQKKPQVSDPDMHHGTCVAHVPWCMSGSLTPSGGENVPGPCATRNLTYLARGPLRHHIDLHMNVKCLPDSGSNTAPLSNIHWTCKMPVRYILSSVWVRLSILSSCHLVAPFILNQHIHPFGIINPKNHCYMNSVIQLLFSILRTISQNFQFNSNTEGSIS